MMLWCQFGALDFLSFKSTIHPSHILTIYIRYIFNTEQQHKGTLWSVFRGMLPGRTTVMRDFGRKSKWHIHGQYHSYLCVWKHVAEALDELET